MLPEDLPFRVIRINSEDEILARAANLIIGRAAYETAVRLFPKDVIQYRNGAQIIARSDRGGAERITIIYDAIPSSRELGSGIGIGSWTGTRQ
jgi:hypothetical protein